MSKFVCNHCFIDYGDKQSFIEHTHKVVERKEKRAVKSTTKSQTDNTELRKSIHMAMLAKSESAKDCGEITVVPLGFAVDVALQAVQAKLKEAYQQGYDDRTLEADHELEQQDITSRIDELENIVKKAEIKGASFTFEYKYFADRLTELRSKL